MSVGTFKGSAAILLLAVSFNPVMTAAQGTSANVTAPDPAAVTALVTRLEAVIAELPANATITDIQGALTLALDQAAQPLPVVQAAIDQILAKKPKPAVAAALQRVRSGYGAGTGGTGGQSGSGLGNGPQVGGAGSGTDYTGGQ